MDVVPAIEETSSLSPAERLRAAKIAGSHSPKARKSRITNGSTLLPTASGCSVWARLMRDVLGNLTAHAGGADMLSETQRLAARRISVLEAELIYLENEIALARQEGRDPDPNKLDLYGRLADRQRRIAGEALGWQRTQRNVTPTLGELLRQDVMRQQADDGAA